MTSVPTRPSLAAADPSIDLAAVLPDTTDCTILTPDASTVAHGRCDPRRPAHLEEAYSVQLSAVLPQGALEMLVYQDKPNLTLRLDSGCEVAVRLDHMTGPPERRQFFCHLQDA